jgi:2,4-dienoyl-CoA reductase-like NADH-dependent reductase (Old Yellow Enzyme family)
MASAVLSPGAIGRLSLESRVLMGSMHMGLEALGDGGAALAAFYAERARSAALLVTGGWAVDGPAMGGPDYGRIDTPEGAAVLERCVEAVHAAGGACVVTADHGNADHMLEDDGSVNTAHSLNPVPFIVTADGAGLDREGILADVAPTILALMGIDQPAEMTGRSLLA